MSHFPPPPPPPGRIPGHRDPHASQGNTPNMSISLNRNDQHQPQHISAFPHPPRPTGTSFPPPPSQHQQQSSFPHSPNGSRSLPPPPAHTGMRSTTPSNLAPPPPKIGSSSVAYPTSNHPVQQQMHPQHSTRPSGPHSFPQAPSNINTSMQQHPHAPPPPHPQYGQPPPSRTITNQISQPPFMQYPPPAPHMHQQHQQVRPPPPSPLSVQGQAQYPSSSAPPMQQHTPPRLDPSQMPRPPLCTFPQDTNLPIYYPRAALNDAHHDSTPPLAETRFASLDDGNCTPDMMRSSVYSFPKHRGVWHATGDVPLGVICTPLAVHSDDFVPRPRVSHDNATMEDWHDAQHVHIHTGGPPPRCQHCNAYVNSFFGQDGTCNFCGSNNYKLVNSGLLMGMPMQLGTIEYPVDGPYITRDIPVQPVHLYAMDLTCPRIKQYLPILARLGEDMLYHYGRQPQSLPPRIGVCLVSSMGIAVHAHVDSVMGQYTIVPDVTEEPFAPLPLMDWTYDLSNEQGLLVWKSFVETQLELDIQALKDRAKGKNSYGQDGLELSCGGAGLKFLSEALKESGGRGTLISWRRPNFGVGSIPHRPERIRGRLRPDEDDIPCTPLQIAPSYRSQLDESAAKFYKALGESCVKNRVSLDIIMHSDLSLQYPFLDLATLGELCRVTSGKIAWINAHDWESPFYEELTRQIYSFSGWDVVFKLRCSDGIQVKSMLCTPGITVEELVGSPELEMSSLSPTTSLAIDLDHRVGGIKKDQRFVFLQSATLYSTLTGLRRVRVSTLAIQTTTVVKEVFRTLDFSATSTLLLRRAVTNLRNMEGSVDVSLRTRTRDALYIQCVHMLAAYRKDTGVLHEQLLLPKRLTSLPLFLMCLLKSPMLRLGVGARLAGSTSGVTIRPSSDERALGQFHCATASPTMVMLLLYPRIFSIASLSQDQNGYGEWQPSEASAEFHGFVRLPPDLHPSLENLEDDGLYIVDGGLKMYIVVGKDVADEIKGRVHRQPLAEWNPPAARFLWQLRTFNSIGRGCESELRPTYAPLSVVYQQGDHQAPLELAVMELMVEDAIGGQRDYGDFIMTMHRNIVTHKAS